MCTLSLPLSHNGHRIGSSLPPEPSSKPLYEAIIYIHPKRLILRVWLFSVTKNIRLIDVDIHIKIILGNSLFINNHSKIPLDFKDNKLNKNTHGSMAYWIAFPSFLNCIITLPFLGKRQILLFFQTGVISSRKRRTINVEVNLRGI